ncbi:MAG: hypothetical protein KIS66_09915 [Fimbriimonadaceae bacterium]|nr:hypothetical protein [Fimbriimonadaceae bacterium]
MSSKLDNALADLRAERPDPDAKARALLSLRAARRRAPRLAWAAAATIAVGAATFGAWPRPSYAAEVRTLVERLTNVANLTMRHYRVSGTGAAHRSLVVESLTLDDRTCDRYPERADGYVQYSDRNTTIDVLPGYAVREERRRPTHRVEPLAPGFLAHANATNVRKARDGSTTIYTFDWERGSDRGTLRLTADAESGRVLTVKGLSGKYADLECEWEYGTVTPSQVTFQPGKGFPLYDLTAQRRSFLAAMHAHPEPTAKDGRSVRLIGVYGDESGRLIALVEGAGAVREENRRAPTLDGKRGEPFAMALNGWENGFDVPFRVGERSILAVGGSFGKVGNRAKELVVPVTFDGDNFGDAVFRDVPIVRTGDLVRLFTPENRPFWVTGPSGGATTSPGHGGH